MYSSASRHRHRIPRSSCSQQSSLVRVGYRLSLPSHVCKAPTPPRPESQRGHRDCIPDAWVSSVDGRSGSIGSSQGDSNEHGARLECHCIRSEVVWVNTLACNTLAATGRTVIVDLVPSPSVDGRSKNADGTGRMGHTLVMARLNSPESRWRTR
jgi:hypothetical protein